LVAAYHRILPLAAEEVEVLFDLIATRLVLTAVITNWRVTVHPENRDYILRNAPAAWRGLERLASLRRDTARAILSRACMLE
jgi:Ser/Thr protein kinase RdoA (MazF antagonist)